MAKTVKSKPATKKTVKESKTKTTKKSTDTKKKAKATKVTNVQRVLKVVQEVGEFNAQILRKKFKVRKDDLQGYKRYMKAACSLTNQGILTRVRLGVYTLSESAKAVLQ